MRYGWLIAACAVLHAQVAHLAGGHPDLGSGGVWLPRQVANLASAGELPLQPSARLIFLENSAAKQNDTAARCLPPGVPRIMLQPRPFEIVQAPNRIMILFEGGAHVWRQIWMDGRNHPKDPNPNWLGHSIGRWDGDTLVADSVGFNDRTWLDDAGHPHTEQLHVIERFSRPGTSAMKYEVVIDDPGAYTKSWSATSSFSFERGGKLEEDICLDKISR